MRKRVKKEITYKYKPFLCLFFLLLPELFHLVYYLSPSFSLLFNNLTLEEKRRMLLITSADQLMGYSITSHLAQFDHLRSHLRVLCETKSRCHGFRRAGIDVHQVDYNHPNQLSVALRGVDHVVLVIGNEANRVKHAKNICEAASRSGVKSIICVSHVGAVSRNHSSLQDYFQIEQEVIQLPCQYTILR